MRWDNSKFKDIKPKKAKINKKNYKYEDAFGKGIDIDMNFGERVFEKIVKIDSLEALGEIPEGAEYLEIVFEVETNMIIDGWNKHDEFEITETIRLGDYSYLEQPMAWDSSEVEVCDNEGGEMNCRLENDKVKLISYLRKDNNKLYFIKNLPVDWLRKVKYPIYTDADVTYGTTQDFETGDSSMIGGEAVCEIDSDKFVVVFRDNTDSSEIKARVGTVSGTTMTFGTVVSVSGNGVAGGGYVGTCSKLDTDKFVHCWEDSGNDPNCTVGTVSTRTITLGTTTAFGLYSDVAGGISSAQLDTDKFVLAWQNDNTRTRVKAATVSGTTITAGTSVVMTEDSTILVGSAQLDTDKFVTCFNDAQSDGVCEVATVSTRTITANGTEYEYEGTGTGSGTVEQITTDKFVVGWGDTADATRSLRAKIATVSSGAITFGTEATIESNDIGAVGIAVVDSSRFVAAYEDDDDTDDGESVLSSFSGTTITPGSNEDWDTGTVFGISAALISSNKIVICYVDDDGGDDGACIIGDVSTAEEEARNRLIIVK